MARKLLSLDEAVALVSAGKDEQVEEWTPENDVDSLEKHGVFELLLDTSSYTRDWDSLLAEVVFRFFTVGDIPDLTMVNITALITKDEGDFDYPETHALLTKWNAWEDFNDQGDDYKIDLDDWDDFEEIDDYDSLEEDRVLSRWDLE